jgi:hypothetical protein
MLSTFAYQYTEDLPTDITARQNVLVVLCDTKGNLSESISHPSNRYFLSLLEGWSRIAKLAVWDYGCAFAFPHNLPVASEYAIPDDTLLLRKYNLGAYYMEMSDIAHPDAREYKYYLLTKFMENPALDFTTESREFADKYYGEAGPLFLKYRELLRDSGKRKKSFIPMDPYGAGMYPHLDFDTVTAAEKLFDQGEKMLAGDEILLKRWNEARIGIDRAALARRQYILQEHIRRGGTFADYPLDNNVILARLKKSQPAYMDRYIKQQAVSPHLKSNWTKTLIAVEKEFDTFSEKIPEKCLKVPEKFADIEPERVFDFTPFQMVIRSPNIVKVDDSEALSGCAIRIFDSREAPKKPNQLPIRGGLFSYEDWKDYTTCWISEGMFSESGYQWFNLGSLPSVKSSACLAIPSWALLIPVADALDAKYPDSSFDLWIRAKFTGTGYPFGKKEDNNACLFDRLVLIKDFPLRVPGGNEKAVTVNGSSSYAVCKTGKEQWYFEYKRRFGLKENAPWRDELGPDLDSFWWVHPKYNHICGFNGNLNFKFDLPEDAGSMQLEAEIGNSADSKTRTFAVQYSFDGNTYLTAGEQKFYPNPGHIAKQISLPEHPKTVWVRFLRKIEPGDSSAYGCGALFKKICIRFDS